MKKLIAILILLSLPMQALSFYGDYSSPGLDTQDGYENPPFSIITFGDANSEPELLDYAAFLEKAEWLNTKVIMALGDMGHETEGIWTDHLSTLATARGQGIPFLYSWGHHDYDDEAEFNDNVTPTLVTTARDAAFPLSTWSGLDSYGGAYDAGPNYYWIELYIYGQHWIFMATDFGYDAAQAAWIKGVITANPDCKFVMGAHGTVNNTDAAGTPPGAPGLAQGPLDGYWSTQGSDAPNHYYNYVNRTIDGLQLWDDYLDNAEVPQLWLSSHAWGPQNSTTQTTREDQFIAGKGAGTVKETTDGGIPVYMTNQNYQGHKNDAGGGIASFSRIYTYYPRTQCIRMRAYNITDDYWMAANYSDHTDVFKFN